MAIQDDQVSIQTNTITFGGCLHVPQIQILLYNLIPTVQKVSKQVTVIHPNSCCSVHRTDTSCQQCTYSNGLCYLLQCFGRQNLLFKQPKVKLGSPMDNDKNP